MCEFSIETVVCSVRQGVCAGALLGSLSVGLVSTCGAGAGGACFDNRRGSPRPGQCAASQTGIYFNRCCVTLLFESMYCKLCCIHAP